MSQNAQLVGLDKANKAVERLPAYAQFEAQAAATVTAANVARVAASLAPRSSRGSHGHRAGFLAGSIHWKAGRGITAIVGVAKAAFYWKFLEYGTRTITAQPFIRPAADGERTNHKARFMAGLARAKSRIVNG